MFFVVQVTNCTKEVIAALQKTGWTVCSSIPHMLWDHQLQTSAEHKHNWHSFELDFAQYLLFEKPNCQRDSIRPSTGPVKV